MKGFTLAKMDDRGAQVLRFIIEDHIGSAEPVGSRTISKQMESRLSPATIRNIMSDLEEAGFLFQPHTSAGRIPTATGFRYYVDYLLSLRTLAEGEKEELDRAIHGELPADELIRRTSRLLSDLSGQACVMVVSKMAHQPLRSIGFLRAASDKILLVAVMQGGWVEHRLVEGETDLTTDDIEKINAFLSEFAIGLSLPQLKERILREMRNEKAAYDRLMGRALALSSRALSSSADRDVIVEGRTNILDKPEFSEDVAKLKRILHAFEEKSVIVKLLDRALDSDALQVSIGAENTVEDLPDVSVVSAGCPLGDGSTAGIGLVGPVRMDYSRVIPLVEYTARLLGTIFQKR